MADFQQWDMTTHPIIRLEDDWNNLLAHGLEKPTTFIVRKNGSYYEAINGATGVISYGGADNAGATDGTNEDDVQQAAIDATTTDGGVVYIKDRDLGTVTLKDGVIVVVENDGVVNYRFTNPNSETLCSNPNNAVMFNVVSEPTNDPTTGAWNAVTADITGAAGMTKYLVAGYFGADSGTSDCLLWGLNPLVNIAAGAGAAANAIGVEIDVNNSKANSLGHGLTVEGTGAFDCSHAIWIKRAGAGEWEYGITFQQVKILAVDMQGDYSTAAMKWVPASDTEDTFYYITDAADVNTILAVKKGGLFIDQIAAFIGNFLEFKHDGTAIYKMDKDGVMTFGGDVVMKRYSANIFGLVDDIFFSQFDNAADTFIAANVVADSDYRFLVQANGTILMGSGAAVGDTNLYRGGANLLKTDDEFMAVSGFDTTSQYEVNGTQVVGAQGAAVANATTQDVAGGDTVDEAKIEADLTSCKNAINAIISRLEAHGLIAT